MAEVEALCGGMPDSGLVEDDGDGSTGVPKETARRRVAAVIDFENFRIECRNRGLMPTASALKRMISSIGATVELCAVFVDTSMLNVSQRISLFHQNFLVVDCPRIYRYVDGARTAKETVDQTVISFVDMVISRMSVDEVIFASADRDYLRCVQNLRDRGIAVTLAVPSRATQCSVMGGVTDRRIYLEDFLEEHSHSSDVARVLDGPTGDTSIGIRERFRLEVIDEMVRLAALYDCLSFEGWLDKLLQPFSSVLRRKDLRVTVSSLVKDGVLVPKKMMLSEILPKERLTEDQERTIYVINEQHALVKAAYARRVFTDAKRVVAGK